MKKVLAVLAVADVPCGFMVKADMSGVKGKAVRE